MVFEELDRPLAFLNEMKFLAVHPSCLMYSKIYLRLEPLGLELVAAAAERAGHSVQLIDLQCESHRDFFRVDSALAARCDRVLAAIISQTFPKLSIWRERHATCCRMPLFASVATASHLFRTKFCSMLTVLWIAC